MVVTGRQSEAFKAFEFTSFQAPWVRRHGCQAPWVLVINQTASALRSRREVGMLKCQEKRIRNLSP
jgi:hypothetical protein